MEPKLTIEFTASEIQNLGALLDAAVKATGIQGGKIAVPIMAKLEEAVAAHNAANNPAQEEKKEAA